MQIKTKYGIVEGIAQNECIVFKGIPYAKPPVGDLRWKPPKEPECWKQVYSADRFSNRCEQRAMTRNNPMEAMFIKEFYDNPDYLPDMSEDCLYLNIWIPRERNQEHLPVAFWIHGGAFSGGYGSEMEFDGEEYCKRGIIFVTINYRLGLYGFLTHPWLAAENEKGISGNYGILDQLAALKWVYENIGQFGGDEKQITVFGQSAGSMSTQVLVSSELSGKMISKAILQSGISFKAEILPAPTMEEAFHIGKRFVELTGADSLQELRTLPTAILNEAKDRLDGELMERGIPLTMVPNVDGYVLRTTVSEAVEQGTVKNIPYMLGTVLNELGDTQEDIERNGHGRLYEECVNFSYHLEELRMIPSYVYYFRHRLPGDNHGTFHTCELWYTMGTLERCWRPWKQEDYELKEEILNYWASFIKKGIPFCAGKEAWEKCSLHNPYIKVFR